MLSRSRPIFFVEMNGTEKPHTGGGERRAEGTVGVAGMRATRWAGPAIACIGLLLLAIGPHVQPHSKLERVPLARSHGRYEKPRPGVAESVPNVGRFQAVMGHAQFRLRRDRPVTDDRHFYIKHAVNFRARPQLMRVAPWRALYSVSMDADPQSFLQQAPETGNVGLFHGSMPHLRGESGGTPEYK